MNRKINNINRNTSNAFNHMHSRVERSNLVTPDIFVSEIWMQEDSKNGVEIIELNSSNSEVGETTQEPIHNFSQAWGFVNHDRFIDVEKDYRINEIAREKRRRKFEEECSVAYTSEFSQDHDIQTNFNGFHYEDDSPVLGMTHTDQMNCFTIINNHILHSDSSSDSEYTRVKEIQPQFNENYCDNKHWDHVYKDDIVAYEPINSEQRMVWIYSFKNKRRLSENDFELVNIPSQGSSGTSSPISDGEVNEKDFNMLRIASPIPASFIPRLDLSLAQTLSTVTEKSEAKNSEQSSKESLIIKPVFQPVNNWLTERNTHKAKTDATNVVNWMALSPRERRRRFKNTLSDSDRENQNRKETFTFAEGIVCYEPKGKSEKSSSVILVDVEVHANDEPDTTRTDVELESKVEKKKVATTLSIDISYADADIENNNEYTDINFDILTKPSIKLSPNKTRDIITEPIENLNSNQWIIEETGIEKETGDYHYVPNAEENIKPNESIEETDSASKRLWVKHAQIMKSPMWSEYLPITESPPSLHLSISLSSVGKKSWFQRLGKFLTCCK